MYVVVVIVYVGITFKYIDNYKDDVLLNSNFYEGFRGTLLLFFCHICVHGVEVGWLTCTQAGVTTNIAKHLSVNISLISVVT